MQRIQLPGNPLPGWPRRCLATFDTLIIPDISSLTLPMKLFDDVWSGLSTRSVGGRNVGTSPVVWKATTEARVKFDQNFKEDAVRWSGRPAPLSPIFVQLVFPGVSALQGVTWKA